MDFIKQVFQVLNDEDLIGLPFSQKEWLTILDAFDAYTPTFEINVLGSESKSESQHLTLISQFVNDISAGSAFIDFDKYPIFDLGHFEKYGNLPDDAIRQNRQLKSNQPKPPKHPVELTEPTEPYKTPKPTNQPVDSVSQSTTKLTEDTDTFIDDSDEQDEFGELFYSHDFDVEAFEPPELPELPNQDVFVEPQPTPEPLTTDTNSKGQQAVDPQPINQKSTNQPKPKGEPQTPPLLTNEKSDYDDCCDRFWELYHNEFYNLLSSEIELARKPMVVQGRPISDFYLHEYSVDMHQALIGSFHENHAITIFRTPSLMDQYVFKSEDDGHYKINHDALSKLIDSDLRQIALAVLK